MVINYSTLTFLMKIVLTTTFLVAILAIGVLGINNNISNNINNVSAMDHMGNETKPMNATLAFAMDHMGNETKPMNATLAFAMDHMGNETKPMNATLAFAQGDVGMMGGNDTGMMTMSSNQTKGEEGMKMMGLNGTINVKSTIAEAFKSKVTTDIIGAIQAAQASVGPNAVVKEAELTHAHGYLVYKITAVDENMKKHKIIVDPGNGQVLMKKEVTWYDEHKKMKYEHGDKKYGDKKKMMLMKDKKY
jgi:uncharacterized membrane protein YkoI